MVAQARPRSLFCVLLLGTCCGARAVTAAQEQATRPNVVVILTDDQGWGDLRHNGNTDVRTPYIDSLARDGARFDRFYVSPVCSPTRAEFLTGRYHPRSGVYSTSSGGERMDLDELTIADTFKAAGYATGAFGKWHNGMQYPYHPNGRGFDEFYGFCSGHWGNYFSPPLEHNGRLVRGSGFVIDDFTDKAMEFIERNRERPFFAYVPFNTPHSPMQVPDRWWDRFKGRQLAMHHRELEKEDPDHQRAALAMCENIDWNVGRLLRKLYDLNLERSTIVVYFCDNGPNGWRWNGGMKGMKGSTDEGGVRSPLLVRWPGRITAGATIGGYGGAIDLLPTLADLAGIEVKSRKPLDGISLAPVLFGGPPADPERLLFSCWGDRVSVRSGPYRLDHLGELYDLTLDPGQDHLLTAEKPEVTARLRKAVERWKADVLSELGQDTRPFPIGHPDYLYTQIPARDGKASGEINRSSRFPNDSFFTNWTRVEDTITWDVEVGVTARYDVDLYYTCPKGAEGAVIELAFGESKLRGRITEPHDPPLRGAEHDRVPRSESYVKDFRPLKLGSLVLEKGRGTLTLRAIENPGGQIMEFSLLMFTRQE